MGAAGSHHAQERRRRRSGAFAAELLLPDAALAAASGNALDGVLAGTAFLDLMNRYGVGAGVAAHQLSNRGWLSSLAVRDDLIDEHASRG